eukprot:CAMPEP_0174748570 /NCGR_PEP_ID=MMETSP1094-20130205/93816_1 /TAXON_ID=156173 /ORGANISM="Chrysochromulina brevifilum, Strain UTEX LB 985" /LENGTH=32 /DNA_ID= /DNA_START= /DNA_END= /DNA_ORIENTATION=
MELDQSWCGPTTQRLQTEKEPTSSRRLCMALA